MLRSIPRIFLAVVIASGVAGAASADETLSGAVVRDSVQASGHASASAAHAIAASGRATLGLSAVPLSIGASVATTAGAISGEAAAESMRAATAPIGTPLAITDEVITVTPPDRALRTAPPAPPQR
jgi:nitrogen fixation protein FixH